MLKHVVILLLLPLIAVSCASSNHTEGAQDPVDNTEQDILPPVRQIRSAHVQEIRRYLWSSDEVTLNFITTNYFDGARLSLLTSFPKTEKTEPHVYLRLRAEGSHIDFRLTLGSPFCRDLAASLTFSDPSLGLHSNRFEYWLIPERVGKLRDLLRGSYTYKSPPP